METKPLLQQSLYRWGLALLILSFGFFILTDHVSSLLKDGGIGIFMLHYALAIGYFFAILLSGKLRKGRGGLPFVILFLLLFLISAYALNREMTIFHQSVGWMQGLIVLSGINLLVATSGINLPPAARLIQAILLTAGAFLYGYLAIYLIPIYPFGLLGTIAIGIGLHSFVPVLLFIYTISIINNQWHTDRLYRQTVSVVSIVASLFIIGFCVHWRVNQHQINNVWGKAKEDTEKGWPTWVDALQHVPVNNTSEKILKAGLVYTVVNHETGFDFFRMPSLSWDEPKKHDPLIVTASLFAGDVAIPQQDRIQMLKTMYGNRSNSEERLWNGNNLSTTQLNTEVQIWPAMHLAYTEKIITVANSSERSRWNGRQQEAIYIFQLPEGGVVTSLSLWIEGREVQSVLTTKSKAAKAYNTIVGVEARDPSVVHWLEGNRVSVRVFPVFAQEARQFKIGITAPLPERDGKLWYNQITFLGPPADAAKETMKLRIVEPTGVKMQTVALRKADNYDYEYDGRYREDLSLSLPATPLTTHSFVHKGQAFTIKAYKPVLTTKQFTNIYADIHTGWSKTEWNQLLKNCAGENLWVHYNGWVKVEDTNQEKLFKLCSKRSFTLFPFYNIQHPETSLVITKSAALTPTLDMLKESNNYQKLAAASRHRYYVYHIGEQPNLYLSSLRELRMFHYDQGSLEKLTGLIQSKSFVADAEDAEQVVVHNAGMLISKSVAGSLQNAPDHLMRLYAYNYIMKQGGSSLLHSNKMEETGLADIASYAHIVTPVSSMIVLETQKDYDRFEIDTANKGLDNAAMQNNGAVPEPHEWALIIIGLSLLFYFKKTKNL